MKRLLIAAALLTIFLQEASADLVINSVGETTTVDFDTTVAGSNNGQYAGLGLNNGATMVGVLDSESWTIAGIEDAKMEQGISTGGVGPGGLYAFDRGSSNHFLGVQSNGGVFTPGSFTLKLANNTGVTITDFDVAYDIWTFNDQDGSSSLNFSYSTNGIDFNQVNAFDFFTPLSPDSSPSWQSTNRLGNVVQEMANGSNLFLRWTGDDANIISGRDEFGIDNVSVTFNAVPEPSSFLVLGIMMTGLGFRRRRK